MQNMKDSSELPMKLENLLQVPLQIIKLEDLLRDKDKTSTSLEKNKDNGGRLCHSADSHMHSSPRSKLDEGRLLSKSKSTSCLFDCCAQPSRWRDTSKFSNTAKFITKDFNGLIIPVMDFSEDTLTDTEMQGDPQDGKVGNKIRSEEHSSQSKNQEKGDDDDDEEFTQKSKSFCSETKTRPASHSEKCESGLSITGKTSSSGVVLGKVIENPTRFEELFRSHTSPKSSGSNNNTITLSRDFNAPRENDRRDFLKGKSNSDDLDTLKLTFYNEGRKECVKEFRTGSDSSLNNCGGVGANAAAGIDVRYFENPQGLQLSRVLREHDSERQKPAGNTTDDNTQPPHSKPGREGTFNQNHDRTTLSAQPPQLRLSSSIVKNIRDNCSGERTWEQWDGLQISRCQREANDKVISLDESQERKRSLTPSHKARFVASENEKGEAETLIERHLQTYLTSMKYVKTSSGGDSTTQVGNEDYSNESSNNLKRSTGASYSPENINKLVPGNMNEAQVGLSIGNNNTPLSAQIRSSPSSSSAQLGESVMMAGAAKVTRIAPTSRHISAFHQHPATTHRSSSPVDSWPERTIARIPTRPYLHKNATYEQPPQQQQKQLSLQQQQQQQSVMLAGVEAQAFHSPPKRFKPTNLPTNPILARQQHQHGFASNINNEVVSSGNPGSTTNMDYHPSSQQQFSSSVPGKSSSYANIQQQQQSYQYHQQAALLGSHTSSAGSSTSNNTGNIRSPVQSQQQLSKYPSQNNPNYAQQFRQQQINESIMIAATAAAANSSQEPLDSNLYYDRLRRYWEFYQRQELDWSKLAEYYQKYNFYPWDILSARDETLRHWKAQQQQQHHLQGGKAQDSSGRLNDLENMTQHQLALRAMNAANAGGQGGSMNKGMAPPSSYNIASSSPSTVQHGRIQKVVNLSPPQASPPMGVHSTPIQQVQNKYNYNSQQLQQLQQKMQFQHQQGRPNPQISNYEQQQARHFQSQQHSQPYPVKGQQGAQVTGIHDIQNSSYYKNAYNQLAAAAAAVASAAANPTRADQGRLSSNTSSASAPNNDRDFQQRHPSSLIVTPSTVPSVPESVPPHANNVHRQALEMVLKNNFRSNNSSTGAAGTYTSSNYGLANGGRLTPRNSIAMSPSSSPSHHHHQQQLQLIQNSSVWPANINGVGGVLNMSKDTLRTASSPTLPQQTSVIRKLQQELSPTSTSSTSANIIMKPTSISLNNENREIAVPILSYHQKHIRRNSDDIGGSGVQPISLHNRQHHPYPNALSRRITIAQNRSQFEVEHEGILKRRIGINNGGDINNMRQIQSDKRSMTVMSPVPLIAGEEEIVTASALPSTVLTSVNVIDDEETLDGNEVRDEDDRTDSNRNNGLWQYDHVVLLDKRIKTYMCKRCFETLKTEQQIRNHLFCKMLANHVQCHVCLQLVSSDAYPSHLQIHGVRPPDEDDDQNDEPSKPKNN